MYINLSASPHIETEIRHRPIYVYTHSLSLSLYMYIHAKRPMYMKRDLYTIKKNLKDLSTSPHIVVRIRHHHVPQTHNAKRVKRDLNTCKKTCVKTNKTERDLRASPHMIVVGIRRRHLQHTHTQNVSKETYIPVKRPINM